jgi:hypothetical protein
LMLRGSSTLHSSLFFFQASELSIKELGLHLRCSLP